MAVPMSNRGWFYARPPTDPFKGAASVYELRQVDMPEVKQGEILLRASFLAVAPNIRTYLELPGNDVGAEELGLQRTKLGEAIPVEQIVEVVESRSKKYKVGERIWLPQAPFHEYCVRRDDGKDDKIGRPPIKVPSFTTPETMLSVCSPGAGVTAYCAINDNEFGSVDEKGGILACFEGCMPWAKKQRKTVLVTSAAGAVGIIACQLYKNKGCKVIGVTSTREKADKLLGYGCDHAVAYKTETLDERLSELAPEGIDVFFDNVGSTQLDAGSKHMKRGGKIVQVGVTGDVDHFASGNIPGWKEYHRMAAKELRVGGFLMYTHIKKIPAALFSLGMMIRRGKVKPAHTVVDGDFEGFAECVDRMNKGESFGRFLMKLPKPSDAAEGA